MPWCPRCKTEYREEFTNCTECGEKLVKNLNSELDESEVTGAVEDEVFLANLSGPVEISYITSMLEEQGIPYMLTEADIGQYLSVIQGVSFFGKDVYVSGKDFDRAAEIVKSFKEQAVIEDGEDV